MGESGSCQNIDECQTSDPCEILSGSNAICSDSVGAFECTCQNGFEPAEGVTCNDINECASGGSNDCHSQGTR